MGHSDSLHNTAGAVIVLHCKRNDLFKLQLHEPNAKSSFSCFRCITLSPVFVSQPPANFDTGSKMCFKARQAQANKTNEWRGVQNLDGPEAKSMLVKVSIYSGDNRVAFCRRQNLGQKLHDARIRVHGS